eukprot:s7770_g1.t1
MGTVAVVPGAGARSPLDQYWFCANRIEGAPCSALPYPPCLVELQADLISYNTAISACGKGSAWQAALLLLGEVSDTRLELDLISYDAAMSACQMDNWPLTLLLFEEPFSS